MDNTRLPKMVNYYETKGRKRDMTAESQNGGVNNAGIASLWHSKHISSTRDSDATIDDAMCST
jgi:hypothetical protein